LNANADNNEFHPTTSAFLFEFDHLVAKVREATYEALQRIFDDQDLTPLHLSRFGLTQTPAKLIETLQSELGVKKGTPKKLGDEIINAVQSYVESAEVWISDELRNVIVQAREREMPVYALTALPPAARDALGDRLDLSGLGIEYIAFGTGLEPYPRADAWLKASKDNDIIGPSSMAITTSMAAVKSALTAGVHCVVVPDRFTEFQDFGGAQAVVDSPADIHLNELLLKPFETV